MTIMPTVQAGLTRQQHVACCRRLMHPMQTELRQHLVNEEHARHNLGLALFPPLGNFRVNLLAHLAPDLARVAGKQREEALHEHVL